MDCDAVVGVGYVCDDGVEVQSGAVLFQKGRDFFMDDPVVASLVPDVVVCVAELVEREALTGYAENEGAFIGGVGIFPV